MSDTKKMIKMQDLSGMQTALEALLKQAWERGYKYGLMEAEQKLQVKVLIGGEQVYPDKTYCEMVKEADNDNFR